MRPGVIAATCLFRNNVALQVRKDRQTVDSFQFSVSSFQFGVANCQLLTPNSLGRSEVPSPPAGDRTGARCPHLPVGRASSRAISAARLNVSQRFHLRPINVVVCHGPLRRPHLGESFALRCFQRLSQPDAATRRCGWRRNRCTVGPSDPVLSY